MISLKEICFNFIAEEFETFHIAFSASHDETLNRNFEFLQRKFTVELISELRKIDNFKDEYLDFLLNVHLKSLEDEWFKFSRYQDSIKDIICRVPSLTKLFLLSKCSDEILEKVAEFCPRVVEINASGSSVTDTGIMYLCQNENGNIPCPELKILSIGSTRVTGEGLVYLIRNIPSLEVIHHEKFPKILYSMHKEDMHYLEKVSTYNFISLYLFRNIDFSCYTDLLKICLTVCPRLKSIGCFITDEKQLNFFNNTSLETLDLDVFAQRSKIDINNFLRNNGSNLDSLHIRNFKISVRDLTANCPKLKDLSIEYSIFLDDADDSQLSFQYLTHCHFMGTKVDSATDKALCLLLSSSPNLKRLDFSYCKLSPETKTCILKCSDNNFLEYISFLDTRVEMRFIKDIILNFPSLKTLDLQGCGYFLLQRKELTEFVKELSNKPTIYVDKYCINDYDYDENRADLS